MHISTIDLIFAGFVIVAAALAVGWLLGFENGSHAPRKN